MSTFTKADVSVQTLASQLIEKFESHAPLAVAEVKIDFVMAFGNVNEKGEQTGDALTKNGRRVFGLTRVLPLKDRAMGRGDAEITLDGDHWGTISGDEQAALLDHELHHLQVRTDKHGNVHVDDLNRPLLRLRKHDIEVGWFNVIAKRHGAASIERQQAKSIMDLTGQYYWPEIAPSVTISSGGSSTTVPIGTFAKLTAVAP